MKHYDTIFLDRDGTLNPDPGYINNLEDFSFYDFTIPALRRMAEAGNRFCIVTNQSGVARGYIKDESLKEIHNFVSNTFAENMINLLGIYVCTDLPEKATENRKPGPGLFRQAVRDHDIDLSRSLLIGDSPADFEAGNILGLDTMLVRTGNGNLTEASLKDNSKPTVITDNLSTGADWILRENSE